MLQRPLFLAAALAVSLSLFADSKPAPLSAITAAKWRADIEFFAHELPRRHWLEESGTVYVNSGNTTTSVRSRRTSGPLSTVFGAEVTSARTFSAAASRLQVSYSTIFYKFLPDDGLVSPDKEIHPTWADWVAGRDPVLDWIISQ